MTSIKDPRKVRGSGRKGKGAHTKVPAPRNNMARMKLESGIIHKNKPAALEPRPSQPVKDKQLEASVVDGGGTTIMTDGHFRAGRRGGIGGRCIGEAQVREYTCPAPLLMSLTRRPPYPLLVPSRAAPGHVTNTALKITQQYKAK